MEERKGIKSKAMKILTIFNLVIACIFVIGFWGAEITKQATIVAIITISIFIILANLFLFKFMIYILNYEEERKKSKEYVANLLSTKEYTEVIPIKADMHEDLILKLKRENKARFYAIIVEKDQSWVKISLKFNDEIELWDFETVKGEFFNDYYEVKNKG